jgi:hypothetical protein
MAPATLDVSERRTVRARPRGDQWISAGHYVPGFVTRLNAELDRLASLPPNWDAEGAPRIHPAIIAAARQFLSRWPDDIATVPAVVPSAAGTLQFEWIAGRRSLELEIETPTTVHYLKWDPDDNVEDENIFGIDEIDKAEFLIRWFMRGVTNV